MCTWGHVRNRNVCTCMPMRTVHRLQRHAAVETICITRRKSVLTLCEVGPDPRAERERSLETLRARITDIGHARRPGALPTFPA